MGLVRKASDRDREKPRSISAGRIEKKQIESAQDRISKMKEAKAKYSQLSRARATANANTGIPQPKVFASTLNMGASRIPPPSSSSSLLAKKSFPISKNPNFAISKNTNRIPDRTTAKTANASLSTSNDFFACSSSLDMIKNNRPLPATGRMSSAGRFSVARPSMIPLGINPFNEKCSDADKRRFDEYVHAVAPTTPGRPSIVSSFSTYSAEKSSSSTVHTRSKVRFFVADTITESRESNGSDIVARSVERPVFVEEKKSDTSLLHSILKKKKRNSLRVAPKPQNTIDSDAPDSSMEKEVKKVTPKVRRSTRRSVLFGKKEEEKEEEKDTVVAPIHPATVLSQSMMRTPIQRVSPDTEETETDRSFGTPSSLNQRKKTRKVAKKLVLLEPVKKEKTPPVTMPFIDSWKSLSAENKRSIPADSLRELMAEIQYELDTRPLSSHEDTVDVDSENSLPPLDFSSIIEEVPKKFRNVRRNVSMKRQSHADMSPILSEKKLNGAQYGRREIEKEKEIAATPPRALNRRTQFVSSDDETY